MCLCVCNCASVCKTRMHFAVSKRSALVCIHHRHAKFALASPSQLLAECFSLAHTQCRHKSASRSGSTQIHKQLVSFRLVRAGQQQSQKQQKQHSPTTSCARTRSLSLSLSHSHAPLLPIFSGIHKRRAAKPKHTLRLLSSFAFACLLADALMQRAGRRIEKAGEMKLVRKFALLAAQLIEIGAMPDQFGQRRLP